MQVVSVVDEVPFLFLVQDPIHVWSGGLDNTLRMGDINSSTESVVGTHENAIRFV